VTRNLRKDKTRGGYIAWNDNDETSLSTSSEKDKKVNLLLIARYDFLSNVNAKDFETKLVTINI